MKLKMKKVGIITLNGNTNFGNRLQNYALQTALKMLGVKSETIWFCNFKMYLKEKIKKIIFFFTNRRKYNFLVFSNKNIETKYCFSKDITEKYDYFIAGSDQIWNYNFPDFNNDMFLEFSDKNKNIAYAASFGIDNIPKDKKSIYIKGLSNIRSISVREEVGRKIVNNLLNKETAIVLIDPTMLLKAEDWNELITEPKKIPNKRFILNYFLGTLSEKRMAAIKKVAEKYDCEIINILDKSDQFYKSGPTEFLYLEKNAFMICTDSFHSSVFAIIFDRPFVIFDREDGEKSMNSRIETLLSKFEIKNRKYNNNEITELNINHDYKRAHEILNKERKKAMQFLSEALEIKEGDVDAR